MKKLLTIALALVIALSLTAIPAFAAGGTLPDPDDIDYTTIQTNTTPHEQTIPVYGYLGEDAVIPPNYPEGDPTLYDINVSVPTKIIWAAFESDGGEISAPEYKIINHSKSKALNVTLLSFAGTGGDNTDVDPVLELNLTGKLATTGVVNKSKDTYYTDNTTAFSSPLAANDTWTFSLSGEYTGNFNVAKKPTYNMILKFAVVTS
jgi:hypothetical protein